MTGSDSGLRDVHFFLFIYLFALQWLSGAIEGGVDGGEQQHQWQQLDHPGSRGKGVCSVTKPSLAGLYCTFLPDSLP